MVHTSADSTSETLRLSMELTILMPCLNEAETLETCILKAQAYLQRSGVAGEVLIADNGSTDGSQAIAQRLGAR
ncbi:MAG: glycosyltransferase, partial [Pseudomonadota bacterium]|nr:glycosyltransferase [Pseudomonadota bacterium]